MFEETSIRITLWSGPMKIFFYFQKQGIILLYSEDYFKSKNDFSYDINCKFFYKLLYNI